MYEKLLTAEETCEYLRISMPNLRRKIMLGEIPVLRIGRRTLFPLDEIDKWLSDNLISADDIRDKAV